MSLFDAKNDGKQQAVYLLLLGLLVAVMPIRRVATSIPLVLLVTHWIFRFNWKDKLRFWQANSNKLVAIAFVGFYLFQIPGMLYTDDLVSGWFDLQLKLMTILVPMVMFTSEPIDKQNYKRLLLIFVISCSLQSFIAYGTTLWRYINFDGVGQFKFTYQHLVSFTGIHPAYLAMYVILALFALVYLLQAYRPTKTWVKALGGLALVNLTVFLVLLAARTQLLTFILLLNFALVVYIFTRPRKLMGIVIWIVANALIIGLIGSIDVTRKRIEIAYHSWTSDGELYGSTSGKGRLVVWQSTWAAIEENMILGVGTGDAPDALKVEYQKRNFEMGLHDKLNTHNQFLHAWLTNGILGLLAVVGLLALPLYLAVKRQLPLYYALFGICLLAMFTENIFQSQGGLIFYVLFTCLMFNTELSQGFQNKAVN